jgi:DNA-binding XRE family transcriptional regulator
LSLESSRGSVVSPDQCREARAILKWTRGELADAAGVTTWVVAAFEDGAQVLPFYETEIQAALEAVGIGFSFEIVDGVVRPTGVTYSPRGKPKGR